MNHFDQVAKLAQDLQPELVALEHIHPRPSGNGPSGDLCRRRPLRPAGKYGFTVERPSAVCPPPLRPPIPPKTRPHHRLLAEYDALPGIGHGCGHNILGATSTGSGIVLREMIDQLGGTVIVFGTPRRRRTAARLPLSTPEALTGWMWL